MKKYSFISWGLGVQSTWLGVMSATGALPQVDAMVVADTQWERKKTTEIYQFYKEWFENHDIRVEITTAGNIRSLGAKEHIHIPFWTETGGPLRRQCTSNFKIIPLKREMRKIAGFHESRPPHPKPAQFEVWLGISWDEWDRMSDSEVKFIANRYPLVEQKLTRWDCLDGFERMGLPIPIKSACIGCPYRDAEEWLNMKINDPDEFEDACKFDDENRNNPLADRGSTADKLYVWRGGIPLREVDFEAEAKKKKQGKQIPLLVCTGQVCWI